MPNKNNIFRMQGDDPQGNSGLENTIKNWGKSKAYNNACIDTISDDNTSTSDAPTSIPSPFARLALAKTAFDQVAKGDKNNAYKQIVSDCLDLAEICFNFKRWEDYFNIIRWNSKQLDNLSNPDNPLISTIKLFLISDATEFNFNVENGVEFDILTLKTGEAIGATSPCTVFFTPDNNYADIQDAPKILLSNNHIAFQKIDLQVDQNYDGTPLSSRDWNFVEYFYRFCHCAQVDLSVIKYLENQKVAFGQEQREIITNIQNPARQNLLDNYPDQLNNLIACGIPYRCRPNNAQEVESDFELEINGSKKGVIVIPNGGYIHAGSKTSFNLTSTQPWSADEFGKVYFDPEPSIEERLLPDRQKYPCVYISDFLADTIVKMPYEIDNNYFFNGNFKDKKDGNFKGKKDGNFKGKKDGNFNGENESYLLPLNDVFFNYFTAQDLLCETFTRDNKSMIEIKSNVPGAVIVVLRIPVVCGYIEYHRVYSQGDSQQTNRTTNGGALLEDKFGLGIMPLIKFPDGVNKHYRIAMFDRGNNDASLCFKDGQEDVEIKSHVFRATKDLGGRGCSHESYVVESNFDHIQVCIGNVVGIIIPRFRTGGGQSCFTFAVDFGTTNTHIEYFGDSRGCSEAFNIDDQDCQLCKLHKSYTDADIRLGFIQEFIPEKIGQNETHSLPMRTVLAHSEGYNPDTNPFPLADANIPFDYEKDFTPEWNKIKTEELKWGGEVYNSMSKMYLESLFILMRNKVVLNSGVLAETKVVWFYPASMTKAKVNNLKGIWVKAYSKYFGNDNKNVVCLSESKAPYYYFKTKKQADPDCVTIDIGGGTTDVYVVEREEPKMLLSFRYAANAIFGDGYNGDPDSNGFVLLYCNDFVKKLTENDLQSLAASLKQIVKQQKSTAMIDFLFSLTGNKVNNNSALNFLDKLTSNDQMRYVFIVFYASILYFIAKSMKSKGLKKPTTIGFSGNGSNSFKVISTASDTQAKFAKLIFDSVYANPDGVMKVILADNPKIATCKGGMLSDELKKMESQNYDEIDAIKNIIIGNDFNQPTSLSYKDVNEEIKQGVVHADIEFFKFLFDDKNKAFLVNELGADRAIFDEVKTFLVDEEGILRLNNSLFNGLNKKRKDDSIQDADPVEETLFFYPLIGVLHDLAYKISQIDN